MSALTSPPRGAASGSPNQPLRHLLKTSRERLREEMFLAVEVSVKPAMRQPEVSHQVRNRRALTTATSKTAGGGSDDARARLLFMLGRVSHDRQRDDIYHPYRPRQTGSFVKQELMGKRLTVAA